MLNHSLRIGFSFGLTSGIITTLGLMVGLHSAVDSKLAIIGGILTIAIADSLSDAMGIHVSEESENKHTSKEIWQSTFATFGSKFLFALSFIIPVLIFRDDLNIAIIVSIIWGLSLLCVLSYMICNRDKCSPWRAVFEHLIIAVVVIVITHFVGIWINQTFC